MIKSDEVFKIGQFAKPHGIKGEITLMTDCDVFDDTDDPYIICDMDGILVPFFLEDYRYKTQSSMLLKLEGVDTEEAAREFTNRDVFYPLELMDEDELLGDVTWDNFIGFTVIDEKAGELGKIVDVDETTVNVLLQIEYQGKDLLLPAAEDLVKHVDFDKRELEAKAIRINYPFGNGFALSISFRLSMRILWRKSGRSGYLSCRYLYR